MADVEGLVAQATEAFDLKDWVTEKSTVPTDSETVYLDYETAYEMHALRNEWDLGDEGPRGIADDDEDEFLAKLEVLQERIKASGLKVTMRAVREPERKVIEKAVKRHIPFSKNMSEDERYEAGKAREEAAIIEWLTAAIIKIERPDGAVVRDIDTDLVEFLSQSLYESEWEKLQALFGRLSFAGGLADSAVDAGFLGREIVSAGE